MKLESVEYADHFEDETQFWVSVSDVPGHLRAEARKIDGANYSDSAFGMGAYYDVPADKFELMTEIPFGTSDLCHIFYVDNDGDRHWFPLEIPEDFINQVFAECKKVHTGQMAEYGYAVKESALFDDQNGFVLAENPKAKNPFAVWRFSQDKHGRRNYRQGQFFENAEAAKSYYSAHVKSYEQFHSIVKPSLAAQLQAAKQEAAQRATGSPSHKPHDRDAR